MLALDKQLKFWLSVPTLIMLVLIGSIPFVFPIFSKYEGQYFPVVVSAIDTDPESETFGENLPLIYHEEAGPTWEDPYVDIYVQFDKIRSCEFFVPERESFTFSAFEKPAASLTWFSPTGQRLLVDFEPESLDLPVTRPVGRQLSGPWRIYGVRSLVGTYAVVAHQCHPLWLTYTSFYLIQENPNGI